LTCDGVAAFKSTSPNLAASFGYDPSDTARYNSKYRNPVLAHLSAERLYIVYTSGGLEAVRAQVMRLRHRGLI
jgi:hypothetical protein